MARARKGRKSILQCDGKDCNIGNDCLLLGREMGEQSE